MELKFYRHKEHKDVFLVRTNMCGGNADTAFYNATRDVIEAITSVRNVEISNKSFLFWASRFSDTSVTVTLEKRVELDGYSGIIHKKVRIPVSEFELVTLVEKE